nr:RNA-directed DNA polymerase, eukaryota [Tanacetum cinerariifolium]
EAVGNSGGILCVWEANVFKKDYATISDNFVAIYGTCEEVSGDDSESDVEEVSETIFGDNSSSPNNNSDEMGKQHSEDPFKIYDILKKQTEGEMREVSSSLSHPPGFTSEEVYQEINRESVDPNVVKEGGSVLGVLEDMIREVYQEINRESVDPNVVKEGGSVLGVLEDMIRAAGMERRLFLAISMRFVL